MLRQPWMSLSRLASQLGYKNFQAKVCPILYTGSLSKDEKRYAFSMPKQQFLQPNSIMKLNSSVLHTSSPNPDQNGPKNIFQGIQKEMVYVLKTVKLKDIKNAPKPVQTLGFSGLIPFVLPPLTVIINGGFLPNVAYAQLAYGCTILAFLGGVKWGFTLPAESLDKPTTTNLSLSVAWPLVAWVSLLLPTFLGTLTLIGGIAGATYVDFIHSGYPPWFKSLRVCLSAIAIGSLFLMIILRILF